ncbi:MAG TPA: formyltransferase family protein [Candidatus Acidoferrales bacterium]|nr:formyltransferase family protein [Candidatus Acidoferrales bacterium]
MSVSDRSREFVNLLVDLDERFSAHATQNALARIRERGYNIVDAPHVGERYLSWIDLVFDGSWSSETAAGSAVIMTQDGDNAPVGFAGYGARGLRFYWLREWEKRDDVGLFGPVGIMQSHQREQLQPDLIAIALGKMRETGYRQALIGCVTEPLYDLFVKTTGGKVVERISMDRNLRSLRTTVMASGAGTNFQAVIDALPEGLGIDLEALVVNRADAFAIERAKRAGIPVHVHVWNRTTTSRERYDDELIEVIERTQPELILMLGWMHLVSAKFFTRLPQALNIHPAFLPHDPYADEITMPDGETIPAFRGAHAIRDALQAKSPWYGATAHYVTHDVDRGAVLIRKPLPLVEDDEASALEALRPFEHKAIVGAIRRIFAER